MGPNREMIDVVFDTGSDWLFAMGHTCTNCIANLKYDYTDEASTTFTPIPDSDRTLTYLDGSNVSGFEAYDTVCMSSSAASCSTGFQFMMVDS